MILRNTPFATLARPEICRAGNRDNRISEYREYLGFLPRLLIHLFVKKQINYLNKSVLYLLFEMRGMYDRKIKNGTAKRRRDAFGARS